MLCIGRTLEGEVHLILLCTERSMQLHDRTALCTNELLAVDVLLFWKMVILSGICLCAFRYSVVDLLHLLEQLFADQRLMSIFYHNPFLFGCDMIRDAAVETLTAFLLGKMPDINDVLQYLSDFMLVPENSAFLLIVIGFDTLIEFVLTGRRDASIIEQLADAHIADALSSPFKYLLYHRSSLRINEQMIFVFRVFAITMRGIVPDIITALHLGSERRSDFTGDVLRIVIIDDV